MKYGIELLMFTHSFSITQNFWVLLTVNAHWTSDVHSMLVAQYRTSEFSLLFWHWTADVCSLFQCNTELLTFGSLVGHHPEPLCFPSNIFAGLQSVSIQNLCSLSLWHFLQDLRVYESRTSDPTDFSCWVTCLASELLILVSLFAATRFFYFEFIFLFIILTLTFF